MPIAPSPRSSRPSPSIRSSAQVNRTLWPSSNARDRTSSRRSDASGRSATSRVSMMSGIEQTGQVQMPLIHAGLIVKQKTLNIDSVRQLAKYFAFAEDTAAQNRLLQDLRQALTSQVETTTRSSDTPAPNTDSQANPSPTPAPLTSTFDPDAAYFIIMWCHRHTLFCLPILTLSKTIRFKFPDDRIEYVFIMDSIRNLDFLNLSKNERIIVEMHAGNEPFPAKSYAHLGEGKFFRKDEGDELEIVGEVTGREMRKLLNVYDERTEMAKMNSGVGSGGGYGGRR